MASRSSSACRSAMGGGLDGALLRGDFFGDDRQGFPEAGSRPRLMARASSSSRSSSPLPRRPWGAGFPR